MAVNEGGIGKVGYPLVSDLDKSIARNYDVLVGAIKKFLLCYPRSSCSCGLS